MDYISACFEKKAHRNEHGACSYTTAAAIVRSYRLDPAPPLYDDKLKELEAQVEALEQRLAELQKEVDK